MYADFNPKKIMCLGSALLILLLAQAVPARPGQSSDWIQTSIDLTINTKFDRAERLLRTRIAEGDHSPQVWFYLASVLNSKMTHFEDFEQAASFEQAIDSVLLKTENIKIITDLPDRARLLFYRGSALGYRAFYEGQIGKWLAALNDGMASVDHLKQAVALDSTLYDAWLGIGVYQYWRSTKLKLVLWMPFIPDQREEGIANIRKAVTKSRYSRYMAMHQLIYILLNYGLKDEAVPLAEEVIHAYPKSTFMWWAYAHTWFMRHEYERAIPAYRKLLHLLQTEPGQNPNHVVACYTRLAEMYQRLGQPEASREAATRAIESAQGIKLSAQGRQKLQQAMDLMKIKNIRPDPADSLGQ